MKKDTFSREHFFNLWNRVKKKKHLHKKKESNENINEKGFMSQKSQKAKNPV